MEFVELFITLYHLVIRAVALALSDPEFEADWIVLEAELKRQGIDIPDLPTEPPVSGSSSAGNASSNQSNRSPAPAPPAGVVNNGDGTISLQEG